MGLQLIVFDVAGTTVSDADNAVAGRVCDALRAAGLGVSAIDVDPVMGLPKPLAVRKLLEQQRGAPADDAEVARIHDDFRQRMIEHYQTSAGVQPMPGATELFATLRARGVKIALDTGFDRATLAAILARLGWQHEIDFSVTSDEVAAGRPAPDMIYVAMQACGVSDPLRVGKVGDSVSDIEQGLAAGCGLVVAMLTARTRPVVDQYPGVRAISALSELPALIDAAPAGTTA